LMRTQPLGDRQHLVGARHLEVEVRFHRCGETFHVVVLNVPAILAKMRGDTVGAGAFAHGRAFDGVGLRAPSRLAKRRDVINVDVETLSFHGRTGSPLRRWKRDDYVALMLMQRIE
jgi:hypothetical protein